MQRGDGGLISEIGATKKTISHFVVGYDVVQIRNFVSKVESENLEFVRAVLDDTDVHHGTMFQTIA